MAKEPDYGKYDDAIDLAMDAYKDEEIQKELAGCFSSGCMVVLAVMIFPCAAAAYYLFS